MEVTCSICKKNSININLTESEYSKYLRFKQKLSKLDEIYKMPKIQKLKETEKVLIVYGFCNICHNIINENEE